MKLVFIYGAPATGKLTIGKKVADLTGYKLHHNHMAVDLGLALFDYDDPNLSRLCQRIDLIVFEMAEQAGLQGLIFTFAYAGPRSDPFIGEVVKRFQNNVCFIHLSCDVAELKRRVGNEDRREQKKVTDVTILMNALEVIDYAKDIPHHNHLAIDTTKLSPIDAAREIVGYCKDR